MRAGQQFSTRVDVLSPEFVQQLEQLQDNVPAFSSAAAVATVEQGLGKPITEAFDECAFPPHPDLHCVETLERHPTGCATLCARARTIVDTAPALSCRRIWNVANPCVHGCC